MDKYKIIAAIFSFIIAASTNTYVKMKKENPTFTIEQMVDELAQNFVDMTLGDRWYSHCSSCGNIPLPFYGCEHGCKYRVDYGIDRYCLFNNLVRDKE